MSVLLLGSSADFSNGQRLILTVLKMQIVSFAATGSIALRCSSFVSSKANLLRRPHICSFSLLNPSLLARKSTAPPRIFRRKLASVSATTMTTAVDKKAPATIRLEDYKRPPFLVDATRLTFELDDEGLATVVRARLDVRRARDASSSQEFVLDGEYLKLVPGSVAINGQQLNESMYRVDEAALRIPADALPGDSETFTFESAVTIQPAKNTALEGLYMSSGNYCTQCEAESFRRITYYPDRPDVMSKFTVRIEASESLFPILLSNGNMIEAGPLPGHTGRHYAIYEDPFVKPSYLFALVAGEFSYLEDYFKTRSGKRVRLRIYVKGEDEVPKCKHAMESLLRALQWEQDVYGLEYHLSIFNVVAVPDFSMGAMENTSLNIFNSKYILVSRDTATDSDFNAVEGVVAHELFHNYSGNRVTLCRWFELTLKEGLTVFRDQSFSADMNSAAVKRIRDVTSLRAAQFAEDAGPLSHPIRPTSYISPSTFYTATVYSKGAEVIRMLKTLVGPEGYRRGTDLYFSRHDGQAVTCEDFLNCIQETNPSVDLSTFPRWYSQAGTPVVTVSCEHDSAESTMTLKLSQEISKTAKQPETLPALIPVRMGIIGPDGNPVMVDDGSGATPVETKVLNFTERSQTFVLRNVPAGSVPSLFRGFSAPVKVLREGGTNRDELAFLMANDKDTFNAWESGQTLALETIVDLVKGSSDPASFPSLPEKVIAAFGKALTNQNVDPSLRAELFTLPLESYVIEQVEVADPIRIRAARNHVRKQLAIGLQAEFKDVLQKCHDDSGEYRLDQASQGKRALKNVALSYLATLEDKDTFQLCLSQMRDGTNMTDVLAALSILSSYKIEEREVALAEFYNKWQNDQLVVQKWFRIQAMSPVQGALDDVKALLSHKAFDIARPNDVYSLIGGFAGGNLHHVGEEGYVFLADQILRLDKINQQVAARVARVFNRWRKFDESRQAIMHKQFERIMNEKGISKDLYEVVESYLTA